MSQINRSKLSPALKVLREQLEAVEVADEDAPIRRVLHYMRNRLEYLEYDTAEEKGLPIGSGLTEGAHRHVLHPKLKVSGAWLPQKAHDVAQLIFTRHNGQWDSFWEAAA